MRKIRLKERRKKGCGEEIGNKEVKRKPNKVFHKEPSKEFEDYKIGIKGVQNETIKKIFERLKEIKVG